MLCNILERYTERIQDQRNEWYQGFTAFPKILPIQSVMHCAVGIWCVSERARERACVCVKAIEFEHTSCEQHENVSNCSTVADTIGIHAPIAVNRTKKNDNPTELRAHQMAMIYNNTSTRRHMSRSHRHRHQPSDIVALTSLQLPTVPEADTTGTLLWSERLQ
jgi:hypothetical protein